MGPDLLRDKQTDSRVPRIRHVFASGVFLGDSDSVLASFSRHGDIDWLVTRVGQFLVVVVGSLVDFADVYQLEIL